MEKSCGKIGIGITTYNRFNYYKQCLASIPRNEIDHLVIVNDGTDHYVKEGDGDVVFHNEKQLGIAKTKNKALFELVKLGVEHIFLIEDDILIKDPKVFQHYIKAAQSTGIHHLCYEKIAGNEESLKHTLEQPDGVKIGFYHNPQGAFMYINANLVKKLGYFDEQYMNAFEHIDFAYNLIKKNIAPPFWYFPDLLNSQDYLTDIEGSSNDSSITNKDKYNENLKKSAEYFVKKWGYFTNSIKDVGVDEVDKVLIQLQQNYSRKTIVNKDKKLSIIVPYRNRETARRLLIPRLKEYVSKQVENFEIIVVEQFNNELFNKGLMNNIGFLLHPNSDYYCFHDVDLIPEFSDYSYPEIPSHLSSHCSQFNYVNIPDKILGGVITFKKEDFEKVNGYPISYIGWGGEDNNLYVRCEKLNLHPYKHSYGRYYSVPHSHRLNDPREIEKHLINGKKTEDLIKGNVDMKTDGLNQIDLSKLNIIKEDKKDYIHYKIK